MAYFYISFIGGSSDAAHNLQKKGEKEVIHIKESPVDYILRFQSHWSIFGINVTQYLIFNRLFSQIGWCYQLS